MLKPVRFSIVRPVGLQEKLSCLEGDGSPWAINNYRFYGDCHVLSWNFGCGLGYFVVYPLLPEKISSKQLQLHFPARLSFNRSHITSKQKYFGSWSRCLIEHWSLCIGVIAPLIGMVCSIWPLPIPGITGFREFWRSFIWGEIKNFPESLKLIVYCLSVFSRLAQVIHRPSRLWLRCN